MQWRFLIEYENGPELVTSPTDPAEVYVLDFDANNFASLHTLDEDDLDRFEPLDGTPMAPAWQPVKTRWVTNDGTRPIPDFSTLSSAPVFNARALAVLGDLLEGRGELLPLDVEDADDHYAFNCTRLSEALDEQRSELAYFRSGRVMAVDRFEFDSRELAGETIFKITQEPRSAEYVSALVRRRAEEAGLTGFLWEPPVWTATPPASGGEIS